MAIKGRGLQEGDDLFVVICESARIDPQVSVHATRSSADEALDAFKDAFDDRFDWHEDYDAVERAKQFAGNEWLRAVSANHGDGPHMRIELTKLRGQP